MTNLEKIARIRMHIDDLQLRRVSNLRDSLEAACLALSAVEDLSEENDRLKKDLALSRQANADMRYWKELEEGTK